MVRPMRPPRYEAAQGAGQKEVVVPSRASPSVGGRERASVPRGVFTLPVNFPSFVFFFTVCAYLLQ